MKIVIFGYDFPHRKTVDFMLKVHYQYQIKAVISAPWKELNLPKSKVRLSLNSKYSIHPSEVASILGIPYISVDHDSKRCVEELKRINPDVGIIAGARILSKEVIDCFKMGIINFHPGLLPENRGLDNIKWALYLGIKQGVTVHWINEKVDSGFLIHREEVPVDVNDTYLDINQRIYDKQVELIPRILNKIRSAMEYKKLKSEDYPARSVMSHELESKLPYVDVYVEKVY